VENVEHPAQYVEAVLRRTQTRYIERTYEIKATDYNDDPIEFLSILARKGGRLLKGGEPDVDGVAKMVLNDFLRGKIPWFTPPPKKEGAEMTVEDADASKEVVDGREGRLGEMPAKRKAAALDVADDSDREQIASENNDFEEDEGDDFATFDDENDNLSDPEDDGDDGSAL